MNTNSLSDPQHILVRSRPGRIGWLLILLCSGFGGECIRVNFSPSPSPNAGVLIIGVILLLAAFGFLLYMLCAQILADEQGIRWLGLSGWRSVLWEEVTDYYEEIGHKGSQLSLIVTPIHTFMLTETSWTHLPALRICVQQRATRARSKSWQLRDRF